MQHIVTYVVCWALVIAVVQFLRGWHIEAARSARQSRLIAVLWAGVSLAVTGFALIICFHNWDTYHIGQTPQQEIRVLTLISLVMILLGIVIAIVAVLKEDREKARIQHRHNQALKRASFEAKLAPPDREPECWLDDPVTQ